jgi:hypothetical protein
MVLCVAAAAVLVTACVDSDSGGSGGAASSSGAATSSAASTSVSAAAGEGSGGGGGTGGGAVSASIATLDGCARPRIVGPSLPEEAGTVALGRFTFAELPVTLDAFAYVAEVARGQCGDLETDVVYFASSSATPAEEPPDVHVLAVPPSGGGDASIALDPPLVLTPEQPFAFVGVRMAAEGERSVCVVACPGSERHDDNWWSSAPSAPYGWDRLVDSAPGDEPNTPGDGLAWDYAFTVSGHRP